MAWPNQGPTAYQSPPPTPQRHRHHRLPSLGLASSFNLGKADVYPATSGKAPAVARLMRRLHADPRECVALFDDDNDLGMAALCAPGRRVAVSITHDSVKQARGRAVLKRTDAFLPSFFLAPQSDHGPPIPPKHPTIMVVTSAGGVRPQGGDGRAPAGHPRDGGGAAAGASLAGRRGRGGGARHGGLGRLMSV